MNPLLTPSELEQLRARVDRLSRSAARMTRLAFILAILSLAMAAFSFAASLTGFGLLAWSSCNG